MPILATLCIYCKHFSSTRWLNRYLVGFAWKFHPPKSPPIKIFKGFFLIGKILLRNHHRPQLMWFSAQSMGWVRLFKLLLMTCVCVLSCGKPLGVRKTAGHFPKPPWDCPEVPQCFGNSVRQHLLLCTTGGVTANSFYLFTCSSPWGALQAHVGRVTGEMVFFTQGRAELPAGLKSLPAIPWTSSGRNYHQICAWCSQQGHRGDCQDLPGSGGLGSIRVFKETPRCVTLFCV